MRYTIVAVGKLKERFWVQACAEYVKRLGAYGKVDVREVPDIDPARAGGVEASRSKEGRLNLRLREIDGKRLDQRRADKLPQRLFGQTGDSERVQRSLSRVHDSRPGVRQRSVQIK